MKLDCLMRNIEFKLLAGDMAVEINDITCDSRKVSHGDLFVCILGTKSDGHEFIQDAVAKGAAAIITEKELDPLELPDGVTVISVESSRKAIAKIASIHFANPVSKLTTVAITGTKGKTTTAYMIKSILEKAGKSVGMIGTTGVYFGNVSYNIENTTPEPYELNRIMAQMVEAGCEYLVMEASSQSVKMDRIYGMNFDYGVFTNLSPDHIGPGEHESIEEYIACKRKILEQCDVLVLNEDDELYPQMCCAGHKIIPYSVESAEPCLINNKPGMAYEFNGKKLQVGMPGVFSAYNAAAATSVCDALGVEHKYIEEGLEAVKVMGRMEIVHSSNDLTVVIDFAHNGTSVMSVLETLRPYCRGRLIAVFGAGGNRSCWRRYGMGQAAGKLADLCVITTDNPRWEKLSEINKWIIEGVNAEDGKYIEIDDRRDAIKYTIKTSQEGDMIVAFGKGHENYIEIRGVKYDYSEHEEIKNAINEKYDFTKCTKMV